MGITNKTLPFIQQSTEINTTKNTKVHQLNNSKDLVNRSDLNEHLKLSPNFVNYQ